jgi:endonuclease/exonuclease/phosphatase family metal-dependent hydrolase
MGVAGQLQAQQDLRIRLASYNVENAFDHLHDADESLPNGKEDIAFLPLSSPLKSLCPEIATGFYLRQCQETDWTEERANWKVDNAAKALSYISKKPDIITLAEVENDRVVGAIAQKLGYGTAHVTSNSPDHRGIDVGIIYNKTKLRLMSKKEIAVEGDDLRKPTRNILRLEFKLKDTEGRLVPAQSLFVYANHWPSQAAPAATRVMTAKILKEDIEAVRTQYTGTTYFVAMGDFNTIPTDAPHPFNDVLTDKEEWAGALVDAEEFSREKHPALNQTLLPGSYWFGRDASWNRLDRIFVSQNLADSRGADLVPSTFFILKDERVMQRTTPANGPFAGQNILIPRRFESTAATQSALGFSDHLPIGVELKIPVR